MVRPVVFACCSRRPYALADVGRRPIGDALLDPYAHHAPRAVLQSAFVPGGVKASGGLRRYAEVLAFLAYLS
jgi:hypothetical protein